MTAGGGGTLDQSQIQTKVPGSGEFDSLIHSLQAIGDTVQGLGAVSGPGFNLFAVPSTGGRAERGALKTFFVVLYDRTTGKLIPLPDIDITGITQTVLKSTGGGIFSGGGITSISFGKVLGAIRVSYLYVDAEWGDDGGDTYEIQVGGVTVTVGGVAGVDVPSFLWSGAVAEEGEAKDVLDLLALDAATAFSSVDSKQDLAQLDLDTLTDRPKQLTLAAKVDQDITTENEITSATQHTSARDEVIRAEVTADDLVAAAANYTIRFTVLRGGELMDLGKDIVAKQAGLSAIKSDGELVLKSADVLRAFIISDGADSSVANINLRVFEVQ